MSTRRSSRSRHLDDVYGPESNTDSILTQDNETESAVIEEEEEEEVTRCICGFDDLQIDLTMNELEFDSGFFIQCEVCSVWQHGYCVGIKDESESPDKYYCEICRPELHTFIFKGSKESTLYNPVNDKKRRRYNKKTNMSPPTKPIQKEKIEEAVPEATDSKTIISLSEDEENETKQERKSRKERIRSTIASRDAEYKLNLKKALEESAKESGVQPEEPELSASESHRSARKRRYSPKEEEEISKSIKAETESNKRKRPDTSPLENSWDGVGEGKKVLKEAPVIASASRREPEKSNDSENESEKDGGSERQKGEEGEENIESHKEERQRNQKDKEKMKTRDKDKSEDNHDSSSTNSNASKSIRKIIKKVTKEQTQSPAKKTNGEIDLSKPSKPRLVQPRSSLGEMRKRVGAILEYIGRTQIELANEQRERNDLIEYIDNKEKKDDESTANSEHSRGSDMKFNDFKDSFELMDDLTRKLLLWEQKFGKYGDKLY